MAGGDSECMTVEELRQLIDEIETRSNSLRQQLDAGASHEVGLEKVSRTAVRSSATGSA
jgi:hypothetical protein